MSSADEDGPSRPYNTRKRPKLLVVSATNTSFLEQLVTDGLNSECPTSALSETDEEEMCDFDGSDIEDPNFEPSDNDSSSSGDSLQNEADGRSYEYGYPRCGSGDGGPPDAAEDGGRPGRGCDGVGGNNEGGDGDGGGGDGGGGDGRGGPPRGGDDGGGGVNRGGPLGGGGDGEGVDDGGDPPGGGGPGPSEDNQPDTNIYGCTWVEDNVAYTLPASAYFPDFTEDARVNVNIENPSPVDIYCHFIDDEMWEYMAQETNRFATQHLAGQEPSAKSRTRDWLPTTANEMKKFVGVIICMGLVELPHINLYWSKNPLYGNPLIKQTMPRDRFLLLKKFWHFVNNQEPQVENDRLAKIKAVVEYLNSAFMDALIPGKDLVIDETMIPWRGRLVFRQYIKNKSHKYGVKVYKLCTVDGYTLRMALYSGKSQNHDSIYGHTYDIVMKLMGEFENQNVRFEGYLNVGRCLTTDNFYTGIPIAEKLLEQKTRMCGTVNVNRKGLPKDLGKTNLKKGQTKGFKCQHGTKVLKWKDKRNVTMVSTSLNHNSTLVDTGKRNRKNEPIKKPKSVLDYNSVKKGVDYSDQMSSYYTTLRKSLKWYKKVALELLTGTTMVNSWVVFTKMTNKKIPMIQFREMVARSLMSIDEPPRQNLTPTSRKRPHSLGKSEGVGKKKRRRCKGCYEKIRQTTTSREADRRTKTVNTFCKECPGQPFFCLDCFNEKHS